MQVSTKYVLILVKLVKLEILPTKKKKKIKSLEVMSLISLGFLFKVTDYLNFYQRQNSSLRGIKFTYYES